jgi:hypothetical protein
MTAIGSFDVKEALISDESFVIHFRNDIVPHDCLFFHHGGVRSSYNLEGHPDRVQGVVSQPYDGKSAMPKLMDNSVPPSVKVITDVNWMEAFFSIKFRLLCIDNPYGFKATRLVRPD